MQWMACLGFASQHRLGVLSRREYEHSIDSPPSCSSGAPSISFAYCAVQHRVSPSLSVRRNDHLQACQKVWSQILSFCRMPDIKPLATAATDRKLWTPTSTSLDMFLSVISEACLSTGQSGNWGSLLNVAHHFLNDPQRWRDRADEMRSLASETSDPESRMIPLRLANDYQSLARRAERLANELPQGKELSRRS